ncbi:MAG: orotate phosphoribosyltransferase [Gammaproteobacteria bacterium]|nr:orotate phosphoribosyltransferase [Gammaproteobacteria bacterium]
MQAYQRSFIDFALARKALRFGSFTLKSGRQSPYFFNTGVFDSGSALAQLGEYYAAALVASGLGFDMLFGPAYKGIPLGAAVAIGLARDHHRDVPFCFNRKEAKDHGEGGMTLGAPLAGRVVIVDDVISAGTSVNESVGLIRAAGATPAGVLISLDRQERGQGALSAAQEVEEKHGMPVLSIVTLADVRHYLADHGDAAQDLAAIDDYLRRYGAAPRGAA